MLLEKVFLPQVIAVNLESSEKEEAVEELVEYIVTAHPNLDRAKLVQPILEREAKMSTGILPGIAVPHAKTDAVQGVIGAVGISKNGVEWDSLDKKPVNIIFMVISSVSDSEYHLRVLSHLSNLIAVPGISGELLAQTTPEGVFNLLAKYDTEESL